MNVAVTVKLDQAPVDQPLSIVGTSTDPVVAQRLSRLGWRPGGQVRVVRKTSGGARVLDLNDSRVAISGDLAKSLCVEAA
ncbi:MAG: ferrous iron transport protein A [Propionibacteriaceae bacterium]|jgi:Fe2+ transport system protein FeoA|nr:ferrous iron transport protein A [Propionibacteriaceae bacterium]